MHHQGIYLVFICRYGLRNLQHRTARLALPEHLHANSGDSEGDEEEEEEDSEEEDGDPLADLPDETEVHITFRRLLYGMSDRYAIRNSI